MEKYDSDLHFNPTHSFSVEKRSFGKSREERLAEKAPQAVAGSNSLSAPSSSSSSKNESPIRQREENGDGGVESDEEEIYDDTDIMPNDSLLDRNVMNSLRSAHAQSDISSS